MLVPIEFPLLVSTSKISSNCTVSQNGAQIDVFLSQPIKIDKNAQNCYITLEYVQLWYNQYNIDSTNDTFMINGVSYQMLHGLFTTAQVLTNFTAIITGAGFLATDIFFTPDPASNTVTLTYTGAINPVTSALTTFGVFFGFNDDSLSAHPSPWISPNTPQVNSTDNFELHCDLVDTGMIRNDSYSQLLSDIPINVAPYNLIQYSPTLPCKLSCNLAGKAITKYRVWITDDQQRLINTQGEKWLARLSINYLLPKVIYDEHNKIIS